MESSEVSSIDPKKLPLTGGSGTPQSTGGRSVNIGLHTKEPGSRFHVMSAIHVVVMSPVGMNPSLHWKVTVTPSALLLIGPRTPFEGGEMTMHLTGEVTQCTYSNKYQVLLLLL